jgi:hypothetical protein
MGGIKEGRKEMMKDSKGENEGLKNLCFTEGGGMCVCGGIFMVVDGDGREYIYIYMCVCV